MSTGQRKQEPCLFSDLCPLFHPITGPSRLAVSGSAIPVGSPSEETAGAPPGHRLQPPFPSTSAECLGGTFMHFVSPSQLLAPLPPQLDPCPQWWKVLYPLSLFPSPLCFHLQPPLGFLLIPIYSIFIKAFDFCNGWGPTPTPPQVSLCPLGAPQRPMTFYHLKQ